MLPRRRLSLECPVVDQQLLEKQIAESVVPDQFTLKAPVDYHLTVFHLGRPNEIYEAITEAQIAAQPGWNEGSFLKMLTRWLGRSKRRIPEPITVEIKGLMTLGSRIPYAVACKVADPTGDLQRIHSQLISSFARLMEDDMGLDDGRKFLKGSPVFGFSGKSWSPHITVGETSLPLATSVPVGSVDVGPMQVRNASAVGMEGLR